MGKFVVRTFNQYEPMKWANIDWRETKEEAIALAHVLHEKYGYPTDVRDMGKPKGQRHVYYLAARIRVNKHWEGRS